MMEKMKTGYRLNCKEALAKQPNRVLDTKLDWSHKHNNPGAKLPNQVVYKLDGGVINGAFVKKYKRPDAHFATHDEWGNKIKIRVRRMYDFEVLSKHLKKTVPKDFDVAMFYPDLDPTGFWIEI